MRFLFLLLTSGLLLTSCGPDVVYDQAQPTANDGWAYADSLIFEFVIADTTRRYDMELALDHATDFATQNLYVELATEFPDGRRTVQPVSLELANNYGDWFGDCGAERCDFSVVLQPAARFDEVGAHRLVVKQFSRAERLRGVAGVGLRLLVAE